MSGVHMDLCIEINAVLLGGFVSGAQVGSEVNSVGSASALA